MNPQDATAATEANLRQWCVAGRLLLSQAREEIDALNVYPVPDGDTGTNLLLTMDSVVDALDADATGNITAAVSAMASGALLGARGNSGVILSQLLRGVADVLGGHAGTDPATSGKGANLAGVQLAAALTRAADLGYAAVDRPVEGTVLTVARAAAAAATAAAERAPHDVGKVAKAAADRAHEPLAHTPEQLPALAAAGVVDAGGHGLCLLLDALVAVVTGQPLPARTAVPVRARPPGGRAVRETGSLEFSYEVQYLLDAEDSAVAELRGQLGRLGDSLVVVGGEGLWTVHVHVNDPAAAIEYGIRAGRPHRLTITRFADQVAEQDWAQGIVQFSAGEVPAGRGVVAVASGPGLVALYRRAGASVVEGGQTNNPATRELLDAVRACPAAHVALLPNNRNVIAVAEKAAAAAREENRAVTVIPTRSPLQGLSALAVRDPEASDADDIAAMAAAAAATRWAEVTVAVRNAETPIGPCAAGDVLGLIDGAIAVIGSDLVQAAQAVLDRIVDDDTELVTIVIGEQAPAGAAARLAEQLTSAHPDLELQVLEGGQRHYPLLMAAE